MFGKDAGGCWPLGLGDVFRKGLEKSGKGKRAWDNRLGRMGLEIGIGQSSRMTR